MTTQSNGRWARRFMYTAGAAALMLASAGAANAQQATGTQASDAPVSTVDEVVVVGTRSSLQSAMNRKRSASTVSDSIVADDIGQFPDKNVGEALGRVTGVQLSRDFGEGNAVSIRGVEPDLNRVEVNGVSVLSTAGNLNVYGGGGRSNDFRELPAEIVKSIDVFKGFTADMTEGAIGGTVSVQTRRPLDFRKPTFSMTVSGQKLDTLPDWTPRASFFGATQLLDGRLGLMANVTYDNVQTRGDFYDDHSWARLGDFDNSPDKTVTYYNPGLSRAVNDYFAGISSQAACTTITNPDTVAFRTLGDAQTACRSQWYDYSPRIPRYRVWTRDDERTSGEFTAEYKFADNLRGFVTYQTNRRTQQLNDINYGTDFTSLDRLNYGPACTRVSPTTARSVPGVVVDANHNVVKYTVGNCLGTTGRGGEGAFSISSRDFRYETTSDYVTYGLKWYNDRFKVDFLGANAKSEALSQTNNVSVSFNTPGLVVSLEPGTSAPAFTFAPGFSPSDASAVSQYQIQYRPSQSSNSEDQYKLDVDFDPRTTFLTNIKFGGRYSNAETQGYDYGGFIVNQGANLASELDNTVIYANSVNSTALVRDAATVDQTAPVYGNAYQTTYWNTTETWSRAFSNSVFASAMTPLPADFHYGGGALPANWLYPNFGAVAQHLDTSHFNLDNLYSGVGSDGKTYDQIPYRVKEQTNAQYVRLDWALPIFGLDLVGNLGLRRVYTQTQTAGKYTRNERRILNGAATTVPVSNTLVDYTREYTKWLPSFNVNAWLIDNVLSMRVGYAKLMARPLYNYQIPNMACTIDYVNDGTAEDGPDSCSAGNPELKPYEAAQYDLSFEWYPNRDTQFSAGFFYKDIEVFYVPQRTSLGLRDVFGDGVLYNFNSFVNGDGAKISGVELTAKTAFTFLPGLLSGLGADVNFTYQEAADVGIYSQLDGSPLPYPGLSSTSYNATLWYERGPINARLAYNYRSEYLVTAADQSGNPIIKEPTGYLDGKVSWKPGLKGLTLFAEGKNLTEEDESTFAGDIRLINRGYSGRRFFLGATYKY